MPIAPPRGRVGLGDDRHVALERTDDRDVRARRRAARSVSAGSTASAALASASVPPSISRSIRILNSFSVGSWRTDSAPASSARVVERALEAEREPGSVAIVNQMLNSWLRR